MTNDNDVEEETLTSNKWVNLTFHNYQKNEKRKRKRKRKEKKQHIPDFVAISREDGIPNFAPLINLTTPKNLYKKCYENFMLTNIIIIE